MSDTYSQYANICTKFYQLTLDSEAVAKFVASKISATPQLTALFVGGMFDVAKELCALDLNLTVVDYTDQMVELGRQQLPNARVAKADLRSLPFQEEFDLAFVVGRVFTHMISNEDLSQAVQSCRRSLKPHGKLLADNYETSKIQLTNYFNGEISCSDESTRIVRNSTTTLLSSSPFVVQWDAEYHGCSNKKEFQFRDSIHHRAFSREEFFYRAEQLGLYCA